MTDISDRNRPRTVVFYGRVSTEHEAQLSALENQMQWYEDIAKRFPNWNVVDRYIDEGITGTQAKKRPAFMKMIEDSKTGKFDLIVTREVCRFARNTVDTLVHTRALKGNNIEVYFVDDNIWTMDGDGELRLTIMATLAQEESRKVSERVKAGQHISREKNVIYGNGNIFGYELKRNIDESGKWNPEENTYIIIPEAAETIRMIYDMYEQGNGCLKISKALLSAHRKNASGLVKWTAGSVSAILKNATYKGYHAYYQSHSNNYLEQKRIKNNDATSYEYKKGNWEPIISEEQWDRVQELRKSKYIPTLVQNGEAKTHSRKISSDVWVRKLRCSCGSKFRKNRYHKDSEGNVTYNYVCYNQVNNGKASQRAKNGLETEGYCDEAPITEWKMNMMREILCTTAIKDFRKDILAMLNGIKKQYKNNAVVDSVKDSERQVEKLQSKIRNLIDMLAEDSISKAEYSEMRSLYASQIDELQAKEKQNCGDGFEKLLSDISAAERFLADDNFIFSDDFIDKAVSRIVPDGNRYQWHFSLNRDYSIGNTELCEGDRKRLSLMTPPHRLHSSKQGVLGKIEDFPEIALSWEFTIDFETAQAYRKSRGNYLRPSQWNDITVEIRVS